VAKLADAKSPLLDIADKGDFLATERPFKGRYQTELYEGLDEFGRPEKRLLIPAAYTELLQFGGVVTVGIDENLLLFSNVHWKHITRILAQQIDVSDITSGAIVRHIYGRHSEFNKLNDDGSIGINNDLIGYAKLKNKIILVGLIYYAEIHSGDHFDDAMLSPNEAAKLAEALRL
jgi:DNA-binding transcriptional regulator/RsmH inhibitor MraZ